MICKQGESGLQLHHLEQLDSDNSVLFPLAVEGVPADAAPPPRHSRRTPQSPYGSPAFPFDYEVKKV
jgi:hypothetical protein